ncbi:hypothetical protein SAMN02910453_0525 [Lachnospiraceae bacterium A10]|jgi:hypothetical protein|nr:hypothetical protein SAMN02910453_0525 [Lachnospiraceae bacterium A10]
MRELVRKIVLTILIVTGFLVQYFYSVKLGLVIDLIFLILLWMYPIKKK